MCVCGPVLSLRATWRSDPSGPTCDALAPRTGSPGLRVALAPISLIAVSRPARRRRPTALRAEGVGCLRLYAPKVSAAYAPKVSMSWSTTLVSARVEMSPSSALSISLPDAAILRRMRLSKARLRRVSGRVGWSASEWQGGLVGQ